MNKKDLVVEIAEETGNTQAETARFVDLVFRSITGALVKGDEVSIRGFGIFRCKERSASTGRNPRTGEKIAIAERRKAKWSPSKALDNAMNPVEAEAIRRRA